MGRPKGAKNRRTLLREAELKIVDRDEFLDSLVVLEEGMRHFYIRAMQLKAVGGKPDEVDANLLKAVGIAEKVMPYRHHRLAAIKLDKDPLGAGIAPRCVAGGARSGNKEALGAVGSGARPGSVGRPQ